MAGIPKFVPLPWQVAAWRNKSLILLCSGEAGGGKSLFAANNMHAKMLKYPESMGIMLRKTRESCKNSIVLMMRHAVIGDDPRVKFVPSGFRFEYTNGSILVWGGMADQNQREAIRSIGRDGSLDFAWMEESHMFTRDDFDEILARMRGKAAGWNQVLLTTNPDAPNHWIKKDLIDGKQAAYHKSSWRNNPHNPDDYEKYLDMLTGPRRDKLRDGLWVQAEGAVYPDWGKDNIDEDAEYDPDYPIIIGCDDGYSNPRVLLFAQERHFKGKPDRLVVFDEYYERERLSGETVEEVFGEGGICSPDNVEYVYHDPAAAEFSATLQRHGISTWSAYNKVEQGCQVVRRFVKDSKGERRLISHPRCKNFNQEMAGYRNKESTSGEVRYDVNPVKMDDHACDAIRYLIATRYIYE